MTPLLHVEGLHVSYGQRTALDGVTLSVETGKVVAVLGANGAGKTTLLRALMGLVRAEGRVALDGTSLLGRRSEALARLGIALVPEGRGTLPELTVEENLLVGAYLRRSRARVQERLEDVYGYFPELTARRKRAAGALSGGEQQMLAIGRVLMGPVKLLLLDEPSMGLAPLVVERVFALLTRINLEHEVTMLVAEQKVGLALAFADTGYVLEGGRVILEGSANELARDPLIEQAYLGVISESV